MNLEYCSYIIEELLNWGVSEFYVCAGIRNTPLVETIANITSKDKIIFNHFEERSASFYALGRIKTLKKPVAVVVTSGTAVGELLPATMEAYYSGLPLVLLTADRPSSYRNSGAPQAAEHKNIYGPYVSACLDLEVGQKIQLEQYPKNRPLHINVCLSAPLRSGTLKAIKYSNDSSADINFQVARETCLEQLDTLTNFLKENKKTLVIVSQLITNNNLELVNFLLRQQLPVYLEAISNHREVSALSEIQINCGDKIWSNSKLTGYDFDSALKIGGTPTIRLWRDLDETCRDIKVLSISNNDFSGTPNAQHIKTDLATFFALYNEKVTFQQDNNSAAFIKADRAALQKLNELFKTCPQAEQSYFNQLSMLIPQNSAIFLGNSLPIRYWDLAANYNNRAFNIEAARGLNGIDGQVSTFLGFASEKSPSNWGIFGDLTTLYDLSAPWMLQHRPDLKVNICIINNGGGKIFEKLVTGDLSKLVQNNHNLNFEDWARMWNLNYERITNPAEINPNCNHSRVLEIIPSNAETLSFGSTWEQS